MKLELALLGALLLVGCTPEAERPPTSATHQWLLRFGEDYRKSWAYAPNDVARRLVTQDYHQRLVAYITGKNYVLDSVPVIVGRIEAKGSILLTEYKGPGILFHDAIDSQEEVFTAMGGIPAGTTAMLSFKCLGPAELTDATSPYPVRIEATPL